MRSANRTPPRTPPRPVEEEAPKGGCLSRSSKIFLFFLFIGLVPVLVVQCHDPLPPSQIQLAKQAGERLESMDALLHVQGDGINKARRQKDWSFLAPYGEREKWQDMLARSRKILVQAREVFTATVPPILDDNHIDDTTVLLTTLSTINKILATLPAKNISQYPLQRITLLRSARQHHEEWRQEASTYRAQVADTLARGREEVARVQGDHPLRAEDIAAHLETMLTEDGIAQRLVDSALWEHDRLQEQGDMDYAAFADAHEALRLMPERMLSHEETLKNTLDELYHSSTWILTDMRLDYFVRITQDRWCNSCDYADEQDTYGPVKVSFDLYQKLNAYPDELPRSLAVQALGTDPGYNGMQADAMWLRDERIDYFHRYTRIEDGQFLETDWIKVDEPFFEAHAAALGMEIRSKPYGQFTAETLTQPTPPGLSLVGREDYGEWRQDDQGKTWHWFPAYMALSHHYGSGEPLRYDNRTWSAWRHNYRGRKPYYGGDEKNPRFGTQGSTTRRSSAFGRSHFVKSGGLRMVEPSVRGAGPNSRNRGPGGGK